VRSIFVVQGGSIPAILGCMLSDSAISSSKEDPANRIDGKRQRSAQESALLRWLLQAKAPAAAAPAPIAARNILPDRPFPPAPDCGKARTLRQAFAAEGLELLPDPLHPYPTRKVARLEK